MLRSVRCIQIICAVALCALLAGCAASDLNTPEARQTVAKDDPFLPYTAIAGKTIRMNGGPLSSERQILSLLARRDKKSGVLTTYARISIGYVQKTHRRYDTVRNDRSETLAMKSLSSEGAGCRRDEGCPHVEEFLVDLPEAQLRESLKTGYRFKVFARAGNEVLFPVPAELIQALLAAADAPAPSPAQSPAQLPAQPVAQRS